MTPHMLTREQKASRFRAIVERRGRMSLDWQLTPEGGEIVARLIASHPLETVLKFDVNADRGDIAAVAALPDDIDFLIDSVRELGAALRAMQTEPPARKKPPNHAAQCAMKCGDKAFQRWLHEVHGLDHPWDSNRAATKVRGLLAIKSRADLNTDPAASDRWKAMLADFDLWRKS